MRKKAAKVDRPFAPAVLDEAGALAARYRIVLEPDEQVGYMGSALEMPHVWGDGPTPDACVAATRAAIVAVAATMLERGEPVPPPGTDERRTEQVNVRLSPRERARIEEAARRNGYQGVADYLRTMALSSAT